MAATGKYMSEEQKTIIVQFIEENSQMIRNSFTNEFTNKQQHKLWEDLASLLNSCGGARKSILQWKRVSKMQIFTYK